MAHNIPTPDVSGVIPSKWRKMFYTVFALIGLGLGATQVGFATADSGQPTWLLVALAVYAFLGTGFGYTAQTHTPTPPAQEASRLRG